MATAAVALPNPQSPGPHGPPPVKTETPPGRPPSPSAIPAMALPQASAAPVYERRDSAGSGKDEHARSQSAPMNTPLSPPPRRTSSAGDLPPFLASTAILSPPPFRLTNDKDSPLEARHARSSENLLTMDSSSESSPQEQHSGIASASYHNGQYMMRPSDHQLYGNQDYDAMMRPKKRHKTSRACDECRRKKIRCDATSEANVEQCSSCKRAGVNCSFSRVPMKRGPTKGLEAQYIRELEDRLVSLEYSVQTKGHVGGRDHSPQGRRIEYNGGGTPPQAYKAHTHQSEPVKLNPVLGSHPRSHLDRLPPIDAIRGSPPGGNEKRHSIDYFRQPYPPQPHRHDPIPTHPYHQNQHHDHPPPDRREDLDQSRRLSYPSHAIRERASSFNDEIRRRPSAIDLREKPAPNGSSLPIDDAALNRYYDIYHRILPVLPHSLKRLHGYLAAAPLHLRNALLHAIYALTAPDSPSAPSSPRSSPAPPAHIDHTLKACDLVGMEAFIADERSQMRNLLHMQILILLALNADKRAFAAPQTETGHAHSSLREHGYTSRFVGSMIGAAWGCANELKLGEGCVIGRKRTHDQPDGSTEIGDIDGEECLWRRAWWILVILDRWRSASTSSMPLIPDDKIHMKESDRQLLGDGAFHLVRLSCVLGHIAEVPNSSPEVSSNLAQTARFLNGEIERVRETAERSLHQEAILNAGLWHAKLLLVSHTLEMYQSHANAYHGLLVSTKKVVDLLQLPNLNSNTPLLHHIIGFVTVVLVRLTSAVDTRDEAHKLLQDLIGEKKTTQFDSDKSSLVQGYDIITKKFADHNNFRRHSEMSIHPLLRRESESHYNDSNGIGRLAHLAELAVGEGTERERLFPKPKPEAWRSVGGEEGLDGLVKRQGYLSALQRLLSSQ